MGSGNDSSAVVTPLRWSGSRVYALKKTALWINKAVNGLWLAKASYLCQAAAMEYSVMVNSFIESEALTPLKAAEHPRLKSTQSRAAIALCFCACVCQEERKRRHMLLSWGTNSPQRPIQTGAVPLFCITRTPPVTGFPHARPAVCHHEWTTLTENVSHYHYWLI